VQTEEKRRLDMACRVAEECGRQVLWMQHDGFTFSRRVDADGPDDAEVLARIESDHPYNGYYQVMQSAWGWGFRRHWVSGELPIKNQLRPVYKSDHYTPTQEEITRIFENLKGEPWENLALNICRYTGCCIGELAHMTWREVDFDNKKITLSGKTGAPHPPMHERLYELLSAWKTFHPVAEENIFGVMPSTVLRYPNEVLHVSCREASIQRYITIHALRRAMVQRSRARSVDVATAAHFMGHSPQVMIKIYTSISDEELMGALPSLEDE
jgi:integrase